MLLLAVVIIVYLMWIEYGTYVGTPAAPASTAGTSGSAVNPLESGVEQSALQKARDARSLLESKSRDELNQAEQMP